MALYLPAICVFRLYSNGSQVLSTLVIVIMIIYTPPADVLLNLKLPTGLLYSKVGPLVMYFMFFFGVTALNTVYDKS